MSDKGTPAPPRAAHRAKLLAAGLASGWLAFAFWNSVKPLPPGTHVASLTARVAESQAEFIEGRALLERELGVIDRAEQMIVVDQSPLTHDLAQHLLTRKRQRPNLKIVVVTDPRKEVHDGTPLQYLNILEQSGIIVARARLERLRDSNPLYSSLWRAVLGWWSDPFDESALRSSLRRLNFKADERQLLVADDGSGGWTCVVKSDAVPDGGGVGLQLRGRLARDIVGSELRIAAWSSDDDRLPPGLPLESRGVGATDARFLTEGAIRGALVDALSATGSRDTVDVSVRAVGDRYVVDALLLAAGRGAKLRVLLDPEPQANQAVAGELRRGGAAVEVRRRSGAAAGGQGGLVLIQHGNDVWLNAGSADFTRQSLGDSNLEANIELRMPARAAPARAAAEYFARQWSRGADQLRGNESTVAYWRYRLAEAMGLAAF
jgi:hypothetical protein